jgi:GNAT superfamily N-acetyltransferase
LSGTAPSDLAWRALDALSWDDAAEIFTNCYRGYVIPVHGTGADLAARARAEDIDPSASHIVADRHGPVAVGLVACRGTRSRLAAFAVDPRARGRGVARPVLARLVEEARGRGDETIELEVFEHNAPAVRLYAGLGFHPIDRLVGFESALAAAEGTGPALHELSVAEFGRRLAADAAPDLPWQLMPQTLSRIAAPWQALGDGEGAFALVDLSREDAVGLRLLFTAPARRGQGRARALVAAIRGIAAGRPLHVPQLVPERHVPFAAALGFVPAEHGQLRMTLPLR